METSKRHILCPVSFRILSVFETNGWLVLPRNKHIVNLNDHFSNTHIFTITPFSHFPTALLISKKKYAAFGNGSLMVTNLNK
jgi:hypothetical protein